MEEEMEQLADLLSDEDTVLRGYIAVAGVKLVGHKYFGRDKTVSTNFIHNADIPEDEDVLWCLMEKARGQAPLIFPIVSKPDDDDD